MSRDILFKAKRIDNGEWVEGYYCKYGYIGREKHYIIPHYASDLYVFEIEVNTLCQYTGLTDKNGNKIWENDIVEIPGEDEYFKIEWEEDAARFVMNSDSFTVDFDNYWPYEVEVYGNIFDNPELIEAGGE